MQHIYIIIFLSSLTLDFSFESVHQIILPFSYPLISLCFHSSKIINLFSNFLKDFSYCSHFSLWKVNYWDFCFVKVFIFILFIFPIFSEVWLNIFYAIIIYFWEHWEFLISTHVFSLDYCSSLQYYSSHFQYYDKF